MSQRQVTRRSRFLPWSAVSAPIKLAAHEGLPEQFHEFEEESWLAIQGALGACRPLLVRGEPGVGKTQLAAAAAMVLKRPLVSRVVDSRTEPRDLLWEFDAVQRLAEAQIAGTLAWRGPDENNAERHQEQTMLLQSRLAVGKFVRPGTLWWGFDWNGAAEQARLTGSQVLKPPDGTDPQHGRVVLIDEIDKAEADVPNGLLEALGAGQFTALGREEPVKAQGDFPLVIITTNEERVLPGAFIRRCLVLHLKLPSEPKPLREFLVRRAKVHFPDEAQSPESIKLFEEAADLLIADREAALEQRLDPLPGQAEYLDLLRAVVTLEGSPGARNSLLQSIRRFTLQKHEEPSP
ncbi:MAG TPA: AAA family ATPase [Isosphaeraceae bacterium]|nr:AAA family ATPase [Isosphaeraceae bacterium]